MPDWSSIVDALMGRPGAAVQERGSVLPMVKTDRGIGLGWPEMARDAYKAVALPKAAWNGYQATGDDAANFAMTVGLGGLGASAATGERGGLGMFKAYHGSPHDFDKFSMDKIGTGEGAQAYGHGLYFAENEGVARSYRDGLSPGTKIAGAAYDSANPAHRAAKVLRDNGGDVQKTINKFGPHIKDTGPEGDIAREAIALLRSGNLPDVETVGGKMYEVNIDANPDDFLDWDKPLSEQPKVASGIDDLIGDPEIVFQRMGIEPETMGGGEFVSRMGGAGGGKDPAVTERLRQMGFPGIRYLDQGSRGEGAGSHNYVIFDDKLISIARKYGLTGMMLGGAGAMGTYGGEPKT